MSTHRSIEVTPSEAVSHALTEAYACLRSGSRLPFGCALRAVCRKALDIWSADYRDRHKLTFDKEWQRNKLYWRLLKVSEQNPAYSETIGDLMDQLKIEADETLHSPTICSAFRVGTIYGDEIMGIRMSYQRVIDKLRSLMEVAMPGFTMVYPPADGPTKLM